MDELIRELQRRAKLARDLRDLEPPTSILAKSFETMAAAYDNATSLAVQAKRRMAEREPAWTVEP